MKKIQPMKSMLLILLLLQWGIAPCAGACGKAACTAGMSVRFTTSAPSAPACQACAEAQERENAQPKVSGTGSCCHGAPDLPPVLSPQQIPDPGAALHSSAAQSAAEAIAPIPADCSTISRSGAPPPSRYSRAIYQLVCDLRI
jgi:hypothetical protein